MHATDLQNLLGLYLLGPDLRSWVEVLAALALALAGVALRRRHYLLSAPSFAMLALALAIDAVAPIARGRPKLAAGIEALVLILFFWGLIYLVLEAFQTMTRRGRVHASTIFNDLLMILLFVVVVLAVLRATLNVEVTPLLAGSAVLTVVLGLGLQETLGNVFSGLTLQLQRPFQPGDWIRFGNNTGQVQGIGWRSTRIVTRAHESLEIPNSLLAKDVVTNYSAARAVADEILIGLSYNAAPNQVKEAVVDVLRNTADVLDKPAPEVNVWEYADSGVRYRIRYWLSNWTIQDQLRDRIATALWYALKRKGIEIPYPTRTVYMHQVRAAEEAEAEYERKMTAELRRADFLSGLSDEELRLLIPTARVHQFGHGEVLMHEGEIGGCFHILRRGTVEVIARSQNGADIHINNLKAPNFFGEIALMTGDPRTATVRAASDVEVLEISREGFTQLFKARPETAAQIAKAVEARAAETRERRIAAQPAMGSQRTDGWLLAKMRAIFDF